VRVPLQGRAAVHTAATGPGVAEVMAPQLDYGRLARGRALVDLGSGLHGYVDRVLSPAEVCNGPSILGGRKSLCHEQGHGVLPHRVSMPSFQMNERGTGSAPQRPRTTLALLSANGIFGSRRIQRATCRT